MSFQAAGQQIAGDDAPGAAVDHHQFQHLATGQKLNPPGLDLAHQGAVGPQQQLLAGLAPGVKGPGDLGAAEGAVGQLPAVFPGKGHPLGHRLVDDLAGELGQPVDVGLAGPEVAALEGVVEEAEDRVAVVLVIFGGVDPPLGGDGVGRAGANPACRST